MSGLPKQFAKDPGLAALLKDGQLDRAREELRRRVTTDPEDVQSLTRLATLELELGAESEAALHANSALEQSPEDVGATLVLGAVLLRQRRFDAVIELASKVLAGAPDEPEILNLLGRAHNNAGQLLKAREAFERALEFAPGYAEAQHNLGHVFRRLGDPASARTCFRQALALEPDFFKARYNLGTLCLAQEDYEEAEQHFRAALVLEPDHPALLGHLGLSLFRQAKLEEAEAQLRKSLELAPDNAEATITLAMLLQENGEPQASLASYRRVYDPARPDPYLAAGFALALVDAGKVVEAGLVAERLLRAPVSPGQAEAADDYLRLAQVMRSAARVDLAIGCYRAAVSARPAGAREHMLLAGALVQDGQEEEALAVIDKSLQLRPGYQSAIALKITALRRLGRDEDAWALQDFDAFIVITDIQAPGSYPSVAEFNSALADRVLAEPSLEFERAGHATRKGRHTDTLDIESPGPFRDLATLMSEACACHMDALPWEAGHPLLGRRPRTWRLQMWSVVMDSQGHQVPHTHDDGYLSGVYYPRLPEVVGDSADGQAGWIEFGRPMDELADESRSEIRRIVPKAGRLVIFPSYFVHSTVPFESEQPRISIAFDLVPLEWAVPPAANTGSGAPASEESKCRFLEHFGAHEIEHSEHDLLQHLKGVRDVLAGWGERQALCDAGLFHSVYGTESFASSAIPADLRDRVREQLGTEAERLAWLFGAMRKSSFYANLGRADGPFRIQSRLDEQWLDISRQEFTDLVRMTVANWFEQLPRVSADERERMRALFMKMRVFLSERGRQNFDAVYAPAA